MTSGGAIPDASFEGLICASTHVMATQIIILYIVAAAAAGPVTPT